MAYDATIEQLPDPNTTPAGPGFVSQVLTNNTPGMMHPLNSGESVSVKFAGDYWTINVSYPQLTIAEGNSIFPFLYSLKGAFTNFYIQLPTMANPASGAWGSGGENEVFGSVSAPTPNTLLIPNWSSVGGTLQAGDLIKLSNQHKIFMVTKTDLVVQDMTLTLNSDVPDHLNLGGAQLQPNDIKFLVRISGTAPASALTADGLYEGISLSVRENAFKI